MPDERTYGFSRPDATSLLQGISHGEDWYPEIKPRGGGATVQRGKVITYSGCGYCTIKKATWSGGAAPTCEPLITVTGSGTSDCAATIAYPSCPFTAVGDAMYGYCEQWKVVGVKTGQGCYYVDLGVKITIDGTQFPLMEIVSAVPEHVITREEEWNCCDGEGQPGVEKLISFTPLVLVGFRGDSVSCGSCEA